MTIGPIKKLERCRGIPNLWLGELQVGSVSFHAEAIEVRETDEGLEAVNSDYQNRVEALRTMDGEVRWQTLDIRGRPHLLMITPYAE